MLSRIDAFKNPLFFALHDRKIFNTIIFNFLYDTHAFVSGWKLFSASYYRQISEKIKIENYKIIPGIILWFSKILEENSL